VHTKQIRELVSMSTEKRFDIPENSIKHYAKETMNRVRVGKIEMRVMKYHNNAVCDYFFDDLWLLFG